MGSLLSLIPFVGPVLDFIGNKETNKTNENISESNNAFNAEQAQLNRTFQAGEYATARDYNTREAEVARGFNSYEADKSYQRSAQERQIANDFEERMSNTAFQRGTADMQAAGINPMLAFMKGGASTPNASMASSHPASGGAASTGAPGGSSATAAGLPQIRNSLGSAVSSALEAARAAADIRYKEAETKKLEQDMTIKTPIERGTKAITEFSDAAGDGLRGLVLKIEDTIKGVVGNTGASASRIQDIARSVAEKVGEVVDNPAKAAGSVVNSATDAYKSAARATVRAITPKHQVYGTKKQSTFTGNQQYDLETIRRIQDPADRAEAFRHYNNWKGTTR